MLERGESRSATAVPVRAAEVLRYFVRHPDNSENLEGIARWRLTEESIQRSVDEIDRALRWLVLRGLLVERTTRGTGVTFSINRDRLAQALEWLDATHRGGRP